MLRDKNQNPCTNNSNGVSVRRAVMQAHGDSELSLCISQANNQVAYRNLHNSDGATDQGYGNSRQQEDRLHGDRGWANETDQGCQDDRASQNYE